MAAPVDSGLNPAEVAFLCEMELVTVIPRQRLESLPLLSGPSPALLPPHPAQLPLWLALLLKRQHRANIVPPTWLQPSTLSAVLAYETSFPIFSPAPPLPGKRPYADASSISADPPPYPGPPFLPSSTASAKHPSVSAAQKATAGRSRGSRYVEEREGGGGGGGVSVPEDERLPYHYLSLSHLLLDHAADDIPDSESVRRILRDIREARAAKLRAGTEVLAGGKEVRLDGVGALEIAEGGGFIRGVVDGLRAVGLSKEQARNDREAGEGGPDGGRGGDSGDEDDDML